MRLREDGWLTGVQRCPSPNVDARPDPEDVSLLVLHCIALPPRHYAGDAVRALFCNQLDSSAHPYYAALDGVRVSAHVFIRRQGSIWQFASFRERAWHAGQSAWQGRTRCNDFSIGIELEGSDDRPYTHAQYRQLWRLIPVIRRRYPAIGRERIVGHEHIAPGRKTDPGPRFDWVRLRGDVPASEQTPST